MAFSETVKVSLMFKDITELLDVLSVIRPYIVKVDRKLTASGGDLRNEKIRDRLFRLLSSEFERAGRIFRRARRNGYSRSYKTFQRDMKQLVLDGKVDAELTMEGGRSTMYKVLL